MTCIMKIADVPVSSRERFVHGIYTGGDIARSGGGKAEARKIIYAGRKHPFSSSQFWEFQGALSGIHAHTGTCPHCGSTGECKGDTR